MAGETDIRLVVGLGNPGRQYAKTRHNVGWMVLDELQKRWQTPPGRKMFGGELWDARIAAADGSVRRVLLLEPHTYMNRSGQAVSAAAGFYKLGPQQVLIVLDDMALAVGRLRIRPGGSGGGHNGLGDVLRALGTQQAPRLRVGVGSAPPGLDWADYVLMPFAADEHAIIGQAVRQAAAAVEDWVFHGIDRVMETYNRNDVNGREA